MWETLLPVTVSLQRDSVSSLRERTLNTLSHQRTCSRRFRTRCRFRLALQLRWRLRRPGAHSSTEAKPSLGDACLVHGASGGVGHAATQIAAAAGSHVVGTARDGDPASLVRSLGADAVVDYRSEDLAGELAEATDGRPLDVVFEPHADSNLEADLTRLERGGRIVIIGEESPIAIDSGTSMTAKQADADLRFMSIVASAEDQAPILRRVGELLADGTFTVEIDRTFGLNELSEAHATSSRRGRSKGRYRHAVVSLFGGNNSLCS